MFDFVGKAVWVVEYDNPDFFDCNGVFSSEEKAYNSILADVARCPHWEDFGEVTCENEVGLTDCRVFEFFCKDTDIGDVRWGITLYKTYIQ